MRVISGRCKGRVLRSPNNKFIRPTSDKIKEFIFNYIGNVIEDAVVLDLFAGSGSLAIEALSRGAKFAILVDHSKEAIRLIYKNLELTNFLDQTKIVRQDVLKFLSKAKLYQNNKFDVIFADPPYFVDDHYRFVNGVINEDLSKNGGVFVLEHSSRVSINIQSKFLQVDITKIFGDTAITIYQKRS